VAVLLSLMPGSRLPDADSLRGGAAHLRAAGDMLASGAAGARRFADAVGPGVWVDDASGLARQHAETLAGRLMAGRSACVDAAGALEQAAAFIAGRRGRFDQLDSRLQQLAHGPGGATLPDWHAEVARVTQERDAILRDVRAAMTRAAQAVDAAANRASRESNPFQALHEVLGRYLTPWSMITARFDLPEIIEAGRAVRAAGAVPARTEKWFEELVQPVAHPTGEEFLSALSRWQAKADAAEFFTKQWAAEATTTLVHGGGALHLVDKIALLPALLDDASMAIHPGAGGAHGVANRAAAVANFAGTAGMGLAEIGAIDLGVGWVPVAGQVVVVGTGLYLAGDWEYEHNVQFKNFVNTAASRTVSIAKSALDGVAHVF
jgi:hypothetical protein